MTPAKEKEKEMINVSGPPRPPQFPQLMGLTHEELVELLQSIETKVKLLDGHIAVLAERIKRLEDICYP